MTVVLRKSEIPPDSAEPMNEVGSTDRMPSLNMEDETLVVCGPGFEVLLTAQTCRSLYRDMVLTRSLDQQAYNLQRQGELALWLSCLGQEAAQVGSIRAARDSDHVFPSYREHGAALCRGITPGEILSQWRVVTHGGWDPNQYRFHINSLVLSTQTLHAVGYALGVKADHSDEVVLAYLGDGSTSQGDANEAFNWAAVTNAPVVFICQNNQWAISTPTTSQSRRPLHERAAAFGLDSVMVDGNNVLEVYAATKAAVDRVRSGGPPAFVEAMTYRMAGHSTSDDPGRYRQDAEVAAWRKRDPIEKLHDLLSARGWLSDGFEQTLAEEAAALAAATRAACLALEPAPLEDTFRNTLVSETPLLRREREQFTAFTESFT